MRRLPPLSAVRVFDAAARHENFTAAAAELGMTQAAVSYQIRLLEERLGLSLFARTKGRVSLTEAGRRLGPLVGSAFDTLDDAFSGLLADLQPRIPRPPSPRAAGTAGRPAAAQPGRQMVERLARRRRRRGSFATVPARSLARQPDHGSQCGAGGQRYRADDADVLADG